jgi:two-component system response regulator MprA
MISVDQVPLDWPAAQGLLREVGMATVLVVDDDPAIREYVGDLLTFEGYVVRTAPDGPSALAAIEVERPDCVVLDVMMPGMNGHEVLAAIRAADGGPGLPVVMLTAAADDAQSWQAWSGGVDYFLAKPFDADQLLTFLGYLFESADSPSGGPGHRPGR